MNYCKLLGGCGAGESFSPGNTHLCVTGLSCIARKLWVCSEIYCIYRSLVKERPSPTFGPIRVKVYSNERPPWSKLRVANVAYRGV